MLRLVAVGIPRCEGTALPTTTFAGNGHDVSQLFCIPSLDVVRNVIQICVFDQGERVPCIGEAAAVNLRQPTVPRKDPDIDGFR